MDISLAAPTITSMSTDALAKQFLDFRHERMLGWEIKATKCVICRLQASGQRTGVVALRRGNFLDFDLCCPKLIDG